MVKHWKRLSSKYLLKTQWLTVRKDKLRLPAGVEIDDYYVLEYPDWVNVIARTSEGEYIIEEQYRHGISEVCLEIPAGIVEPGEELLMTAQRELKEETGYEGGEWRLFCTSTPNPCAMTNRCYTYVADGVRKTSEPQREKTEDITIHLKTESEVFALLKEERIAEGVMLGPMWKYFYSLHI